MVDKAPPRWRTTYALLLSFSQVLAVGLAHAQEMRFDHLSVEQGLSQGNASHVHQDKYGFVWIGTEDGLNLFDGYTFTIFRNNPNDSTSISANNIRCLAEDKSGNMWIGTLAGVNM